MRRLTLIRHAATQWNEQGRFQGRSDVPLSATGRQQAAMLHKRLAQCPDVDLVFSSPLARSLETAEIALPGRQIKKEPRLMELDFGLFEGATFKENCAREQWTWWCADPYRRCAPNGESYRDLRIRVTQWFIELPDSGNIIAFAHSGTIQMLLAHVLGLEQVRWRKRFNLEHTSVSRIVSANGESVIENVNDVTHICVEAVA